MRILAVDTSSERGSVCVVDKGEILGEIRLASSIQHSDRLFRSIAFLFEYLPFELKEIDLFAAALGPGSFTGLRVGLAAVEGFAAAHQRPAAGATTLEALAWKTRIHNVLVAPTMDARRGEVYGALYRRTADTLVEERPAVVLKPAEWFASLPAQPLIFCGDGAVRHRAAIEQRPGWGDHPMHCYLVSTIADFVATPNCRALQPVYVRNS